MNERIFDELRHRCDRALQTAGIMAACEAGSQAREVGRSPPSMAGAAKLLPAFAACPPSMAGAAKLLPAFAACPPSMAGKKKGPGQGGGRERPRPFEKKLELPYEKLKATNRCASPRRTSRSAVSLASRAEFKAATASP